MRFCPNCGTQNLPSSNYCSVCKTPLEVGGKGSAIITLDLSKNVKCPHCFKKVKIKTSREYACPHCFRSFEHNQPFKFTCQNCKASLSIEPKTFDGSKICYRCSKEYYINFTEQMTAISRSKSENGSVKPKGNISVSFILVIGSLIILGFIVALSRISLIYMNDIPDEFSQNIQLMVATGLILWFFVGFILMLIGFNSEIFIIEGLSLFVIQIILVFFTINNPDPLTFSSNLSSYLIVIYLIWVFVRILLIFLASSSSSSSWGDIYFTLCVCDCCMNCDCGTNGPCDSNCDSCECCDCCD